MMIDVVSLNPGEESRENNFWLISKEVTDIEEIIMQIKKVEEPIPLVHKAPSIIAPLQLPATGAGL